MKTRSQANNANNKVVVTGATGVLGRAIVKATVASGFLTRQAVRDLARADPNVEAAYLTYANLSSIAPALAGASALILMAPPLDPNAPAELSPVVEIAKSVGIQHLVLISAFGVNHNEQAPLRIVERLVIDSGVPFTIVRPNFFMENFSEGFLSAGVREKNAIYLAAGDGKTSFISVGDVATTIVVILQRSLVGREFNLTGSTALDHTDAARIISHACGRTILYHALTEEEMLEEARSHRMSEPTVRYLGVLYSVVRAGSAAAISTDFEMIVERKAMTFEHFARLAFSATH